ncbi:MerR family transcriptional regulator [Microbispora sp. H11081]|uniref:helix-turn-helix domain-containing protein n=1 Tax=Microbispora sp. H11081 TaxID=2729107 RepID=UPI002015F070|nr:MerR family transcriptional regulator [Microbispora sp. H11081]
MSETWTIGELAERAAALLGAAPGTNGQEPEPDGREQDAGGQDQGAGGREQGASGSEPRGNGRVREVPNERLIRWYTTIGLLDPPLGRRGRVALYGRRHLLQLVAVKRRQADGLSIAAIQAELTGATDAMLQRAARLAGPPPGSPVPPSPPPPPPVPLPTPLPAPGWCGTRPEPGVIPPAPDIARPAARERFWAHPSSSVPTASGHSVTMDTDAREFGTADSRAADTGTAVSDVTLPDVTLPDSALPDVVHGVRLAPGVTILLDLAHRAPHGHEVAALRRAAAPLLAALTALGLAGQFHGPGDSTDFDPHASDALEG